MRATALDLMDEYGFDAGLARDVAMQIPLETEAHRGRERSRLQAFTAALVAFVVLLLGPFAAFIPKSVLAGLLIVAASRLIDIERIRYTTSHPRDLDDDLLQYAEQLGLDVARFDDDRVGPDVRRDRKSVV